MRVAAKFGIRSVKFTGGEPIHKDLVSIVESVPGGDRIFDNHKWNFPCTTCR